MAGEFGPSAGEMGDLLPETLEAFPGTATARKTSKTWAMFWDPRAENWDTEKNTEMFICGKTSFV